jgi:hypothetical protein
MRREAATIVALVGAVDSGLLAALARSPNVTVARAPAAAPAAEPGDDDRHGWEPGALAMRAAARRRATYVVVPDDPLAAVATSWQAMWTPGGADGAGFELRAGATLAAWRAHQFQLPDYYLVTAPAGRTEPEPSFYLGPLRAARSRRVAVAVITPDPGGAGPVLDALRALQHGPWWPPLDELLDVARHFYAGDLSPAPAGADDGQQNPGPSGQPVTGA